MPETVLITTQDLEPAVRLRDAFLEHELAVELLTSSERIADVQEPVLLVLTGGLDEKRARRLIREAAGYEHLAVIGLADSPDELAPDVWRRRGLAECFAKPIEVEDVVHVGRRLVERRRLRQITGIVGEAEAVHEVLERVVQIAPVHSTVLITGESGTGKELVARGIHALSPRRHRPFIPANVAALSDTLLESELFGHEKGAFTGAIAQRKGLFELAHRGTLFLDEIGEMPLSTQSKLLRVLEDNQFMRVGGEEPIQVDVRVIAATNQQLRRLVELGRFRRDLYYRVNVLHSELPPLRERREDIPLLVEAFNRQASQEHDRPRVSLSAEAMTILFEYDWPGNIRELRNLIESMVVLSPGQVIGPDDIPPAIRAGPRAGSSLLPVPVTAGGHRDGNERAPELEFIFRTLIELKMDVQDLQREFEDYRRTAIQPALPHGYSRYPLTSAALPAPAGVSASTAIEDAEVRDALDEDDDDDDQDVVVYRSGMTMKDIERETISTVLQQVAGNRRQAAQRLGIGERTLYRKIKEYGIPI